MVRRFSVYGYPVAISGPLDVAELRARLGPAGIAPTRAKPVLTVELVPDLRAFEGNELIANDPNLMLGEGFVLNYARRTLYYPLTGALHLELKNLGPQLALPRTILFCLGLLAEHNGLETVLHPPSAPQAPLYLHASSVGGPRGALIFCGECTFGKSTISSELLSDCAQLEDDQVNVLISPLESKRPQPPRVVSFEHSREEVLGEAAEAAAAFTIPLAGIFWLKKAPFCAFEKMEQAEAASLLLAPMVNWKHGASIKNRLRLLHALFNAVPCRRLAFPKDADAVRKFLGRNGYL